MQAAVTLPENACASKNGLSIANSNPCNNIDSCVIPELKRESSHFKIRIALKGRNRSALVVAMVDCGATALFISKRFVKENKIRTHLISCEIPLYNIDGSRNRAGSITHATCLRLRVGDVEEWQVFWVTELGPEDVVLGLPWLRSTNPSIDWAKGRMKIDSASERNDPKVEQVAANRMQ
jgi:Retroviral aspartyl protease